MPRPTRPFSLKVSIWLSVLIGVVITLGIMLGYGFRDLDILRHEAHATATITRPGNYRRSGDYQYQVDGQTYTASGNPSRNLAPYTVGKTFPISYSTATPSRSTPRSPERFLDHIAGTWSLLAIMTYLDYRRRKNGRPPQSRKS